MCFACDDTVTLIRHTKQANTDSYTCERIVGVSWYGKRGIAPDANGMTPKTEYTVRIPEEALVTMPQPGDLLVHGMLEEYTGRRYLTDREFFEIAYVGDNRRGSFLRHVVVKNV